jgi:hypothetical protein
MTKRWSCNAALLVVILGGFVGCRSVDELHSAARRAWKNDSLAQIAARADDADWRKQEQIRLSNQEVHSLGSSERWLSDQLILMSNGDWLIYTNVCHKQKGHIHDLFLAKGSDGQWYYSTYHFCSGMMVLREEEQSATRADFVRTYSLRPFDGHSDDCLQQTWPPPN